MYTLVICKACTVCTLVIRMFFFYSGKNIISEHTAPNIEIEVAKWKLVILLPAVILINTHLLPVFESHIFVKGAFCKLLFIIICFSGLLYLESKVFLILNYWLCKFPKSPHVRLSSVGWSFGLSNLPYIAPRSWSNR